ncbi:MAG: sodium:proton antiporter NhaD [Flammeovirgaceae bacterium]
MTALLITVFVIGYLAIALEHNLKIDKSAPALIIGVLCWTIYIVVGHHQPDEVAEHLYHHMGEIAAILFFLLGAMTIVELIDAHNGFEVITSKINTKSKTKLLWIISLLAFFLSAVLDNLTTTIVMISILRKMVKGKEARLFFAGVIVIAANAGGAWSPIGDVTTTMLWIGEQVSTVGVITSLFIPSIICLLIPVSFINLFMKKRLESEAVIEEDAGITHLSDRHKNISKGEQKFVFFLGIGSLMFVPVFKTITHLPPFMGILISLGVMWLITELMHKHKDEQEKEELSVIGVLQRVDVPSVLFFLGILLAISSLQDAGLLKNLAIYLDNTIGNYNAIAIALGFLSAVVDNVPLVAATMGMYDLTQYATDHNMWMMIAYCAGTGGSMLIIGSAAGVAAMGMEKIPFGWYMKNVGFLAMLGYLAGAFFYILVS